jgi:hypothetical protein
MHDEWSHQEDHCAQRKIEKMSALEDSFPSKLKSGIRGRDHQPRSHYSVSSSMVTGKTPKRIYN